MSNQNNKAEWKDFAEMDEVNKYKLMKTLVKGAEAETMLQWPDHSQISISSQTHNTKQIITRNNSMNYQQQQIIRPSMQSQDRQTDTVLTRQSYQLDLFIDQDRLDRRSWRV